MTLTDNDGHNWPITGHWCETCGMPLHPALTNEGTHPNCQPHAKETKQIRTTQDQENTQ